MSSRSTPGAPQWQVWHPGRGIVFAPAQMPQPQRPLYPDLKGLSLAMNSASPDLSGRQPFSSLSAENKEEPASGRKTAPPVLQSTGPHSEGLPLPAPEHAAPQEGDDVAASAAGTRHVLSDDRSPEAPPFTPLDYTIPTEAFRAAKMAKPGTAESFWSYALYRGPAGEKVKVHYCRSKHTTERVCQYFLDEKVIGFDLEWMPDAKKWESPRRNVCLIQLASQSRVALFHLSLYPKGEDLVAPTLKRIMQDHEITKTGVWIKGDCTRLRNYLGIESRGIFELSHMFKLVKYSASGECHLVNRRLVPLADQVKHWLRLPLFKGHDVRSSDWSKPLTMDQIIYSSSDAYAAVQLYAVMDYHREKLRPTPPRPHHAELNLPIRLAESSDAPSADEEADDAEAIEEGDDTGDPGTTQLSKEFMSTVAGTLQVEADGEEVANPPPPSLQTSSRNTSVKARKSPSTKKDDRILAAEAWLANYLGDSAHRPRCGAAALRTFHIWSNNRNLDPAAVASLLRDPPLQTTTVLNYILEAIKLEKLPFEPGRLRVEVVEQLPQQLLSQRYSSVVRNMEMAARAVEAATIDKATDQI